MKEGHPVVIRESGFTLQISVNWLNEVEDTELHNDSYGQLKKINRGKSNAAS